VQASRRRGPSGGNGRRSWGELLQGSSGLLISTDRLGVYLRRCHWGQGGPGITGGKESHERNISPAATLDQIPATAGLRVEGGRLGKLPDGEVELLRVLAGAGVRRSGRSKAVQRGLTWQSKVGVVLGFESAAKDGDRDAGGFGVIR
jgi:hypothetical protein